MKAKAQNIMSISFRCTEPLHAQAEKLSELTMIPISIMCRQALTEYIKNHAVGMVLGEKENAKPVAHTSQKPIARKPKTQEEIAYDNYINSLSALEDNKDVEDDWL